MHEYEKLHSFEEYPNIIQDGDPVLVTEKLDGVHMRAFYSTDSGFQHAAANSELTEHVLAAYPVDQACRAFPSTVLYFQIFGPGAGQIHYNRKAPELALIDAYDTINNRYLSTQNLLAVANVGGFWMAPGLYAGPFDRELILSLAEDKSMFGGPRAGIVIRRRPEVEVEFKDNQKGRLMLTYANPKLKEQLR